MRAGVFFADHRNFVDGETLYFFAEDGFTSAAAAAFRYMHTSLVVSVCGWLPLVLPALTGVDVRYSNLRCEVRNRARFVPLLTVLAAGQAQLEVMVEVCSFASARMQRRS